jgi:putative membrane-bound dehydrogenase-like protein
MPSRFVAGTLSCAAASALLALVAWGTGVQPSAQARADRRPLAPDAALASFQLEPGYRIDLVASEPLVRDPVAMAFDERGRLYVVENRGYPDPLEGEPEAAPMGSIALLTDTDNDGRYDARTEFATGLTYPNGIMAWEGGVFVTMAPDLLYLKDTTGDGVADVRRVALTGFNATRTAQIRFSHPTLGPDGWIYLTSGLNGGRVTSPAHPDRPAVEFSSSDSRFNPKTGAFELVGGQGQYGLTFDDAGRRFICANRHPVWHVVLEPHQLARNQDLSFTGTVQEVSAVGAEATVWPLSADLTTASFHPTLMQTPHAGTFTSASGVHIHRGDALPDGHAGSVFIMESAQNLVQRQVRTSAGVSFRSRPARDGVEFLATRDSWFRPVFAAVGPDGALYVADMYRKDIDHPAYVPEESRPLFDFTAGRDMGRIYRIAAGTRPPQALPGDLATAADDALVQALRHANGWRRDTAQRLLVERGARGVAPRLRELLTGDVMVARLHALWTLDQLGVLGDDDIRRALGDGAAPVRENGLRLAERRLGGNDALLDAVIALRDDDDARVRLHAALALGASASDRRLDALAAIARRDGADRWTRAAVFSSVGASVTAFFDAFRQHPPADGEAHGPVLEEVARLFGSSASAADCLTLLGYIVGPADEGATWRFSALSGLATGLRTRDGMTLQSLTSVDTPAGRAAATHLASLLTQARALAGDEGAADDARVSAIAVLGHAGGDAARNVLVRQLDPREPHAIQAAAVRALVDNRDPSRAALLVSPGRWDRLTPQLRTLVLTTLLGDDRLVPVLLEAVETNAVPAAAVGGARWRRLTAHRDADIRARATALHDASEAGAGQRAFERVRTDVLTRTGVPLQGARVFEQQCAVCHTFTSAGSRIGPDLSGVRNQPVDALLLHIVVPDYEITPGYEAFSVDTRDGRSFFGRLESEAPNGITLRDAAGQSHAIARSDIVSMRAATCSLMPVGLEEAMSAQDLADLIAYLKRGDR